MLLLPASLTMPVARDALHMLSQALQKEPESGIVIDASGLQQLDSAALAVLLECQRLAQVWGKKFSVQRAPPKLLALAKLYGVDAVLPFDAVTTA